MHLDVLRVQGLEKTYSLDHVIGRPVICDSSDAGLRTETDELSPAIERGLNSARIAIYMLNMPASEHRTLREREEHVEGLCDAWLDAIREGVRKYPCLELSPRLG